MLSWVWGSGKNKLEANLESLAFNFVSCRKEDESKMQNQFMCVSINPNKNYSNYNDCVSNFNITCVECGKRFPCREKTDYFFIQIDGFGWGDICILWVVWGNSYN